ATSMTGRRRARRDSSPMPGSDAIANHERRKRRAGQPAPRPPGGCAFPRPAAAGGESGDEPARARPRGRHQPRRHALLSERAGREGFHQARQFHRRPRQAPLCLCADAARHGREGGADRQVHAAQARRIRGAEGGDRGVASRNREARETMSLRKAERQRSAAIAAAREEARPQPTLAGALRVLYGKLSPRRRRTLGPLIGLMLAGAVAEVVTIGALLPFLSAVADPEGSPVLTRLRPALEFLGATGPGSAVLLLTAAFALAAIVAAAIRLLLLWASSSFVFGLSYELGVRVYDSMLHESYLFHSRQNTSEIIAAINKVTLVTNQVLNPLINAAVAAVISLFIVAGLVAVDPAVALMAGAGF